MLVVAVFSAVVTLVVVTGAGADLAATVGLAAAGLAVTADLAAADLVVATGLAATGAAVTAGSSTAGVSITAGSSAAGTASSDDLAAAGLAAMDGFAAAATGSLVTAGAVVITGALLSTLVTEVVDGVGEGSSTTAGGGCTTEIDSVDLHDSTDWIESFRSRKRPLTTVGSGTAATAGATTDVVCVGSVCSVVAVTVAFMVRVRRRLGVGGCSGATAGGAAVSASD